MILGTSGHSSAKPFAYYDPESHSLKMWPTTDESDSQPFSGTVPKMGFMSGGVLYELPTSAHPTSGNDSSSLLPTPNSSDAEGSRSPKPGRETKVQIGLPNAVKLLPTSRTTDSHGSGSHGTGGLDLRTIVASMIEWGEYEPAIRRWEAATRPAPPPTEPNMNGNPRLTVAFDEWHMGLPEGWIADINIPYGAKIKLCGNGVVPLQCEYALRILLNMN